MLWLVCLLLLAAAWGASRALAGGASPLGPTVAAARRAQALVGRLAAAPASPERALLLPEVLLTWRGGVARDADGGDPLADETLAPALAAAALAIWAAGATGDPGGPLGPPLPAGAAVGAAARAVLPGALCALERAEAAHRGAEEVAQVRGAPADARALLAAAAADLRAIRADLQRAWGRAGRGALTCSPPAEEMVGGR